MKAVKSNKEVIAFLVNCGNKYLQDLLVPARLEATLDELDADLDGEISAPEWERAIAEALKEKLRQRAIDREERARAWRKEMEAFTAEFMAAAQKVFEMIDKDGSGSLAIDEITRAVKEDQEVIDFLENCGEPNLQFLLRPKRLKKALEALDTDKSGEVDEEEWCVWRRPLRHRRNSGIPFNLRHHRRDGPRPKLTARCAQGRSDPPGPRGAARAAARGARAPRARGARGGRGFLRRVPQRGPGGLHAHG